MRPNNDPDLQPPRENDLPYELSAAANVDADVVILPLQRTVEGLGVYDPQCIPLVKELREAGYCTEYLDGPDKRLFLVQESALLEIAIEIATGLVGTAMWTAGAEIVRRIRQRAVKAEVIVLPIEDSREVAEVLTDAQGGDGDHRELVPSERTGPHKVDDPSAPVGRTVERLTTEGFALIGGAALAPPSERESAETSARQALRRLASALNWAEDTTLEPEVHENLDKAGRWVRQSFGCSLTYDGETYWNDCPVRLGHTRQGLSVGGRAHKTCSLCGEDLSECPHVSGRRYPAFGGHEQLGWCRVCMARRACEHLPGETYSAEAVSIIDRLDLDEVSLVGKPGFPDARIDRMSISTEGLRQFLGSDFEPGVEVSCDFCLMPCTGLDRPFVHPDL